MELSLPLIVIPAAPAVHVARRRKSVIKDTQAKGSSLWLAMNNVITNNNNVYYYFKLIS